MRIMEPADFHLIFKDRHVDISEFWHSIMRDWNKRCSGSANYDRQLQKLLHSTSPTEVATFQTTKWLAKYLKKLVLKTWKKGSYYNMWIQQNRQGIHRMTPYSLSARPEP